jgi:hypothetical protein
MAQEDFEELVHIYRERLLAARGAKSLFDEAAQEVKDEMVARDVGVAAVGLYIVRYKPVVSRVCDVAALKAGAPDVWEQYAVVKETMRLTVA